MDKKLFVPAGIVLALLLVGAVFLTYSLFQEVEANREMQQLAAIDKEEMESEVSQFSKQYSEMSTMITNDSLIAQLLSEQEKTEKLLAELKAVKSSNGKEMARMKQEIATLREILRGYVITIDSLNRLNETLMTENTHIRGQYEEATRKIGSLSNENSSLAERVAVAAQLNAVGINMTPLTDRNKVASNVKKCKQLRVDFHITKNVSASCGQKDVYVRITAPTGSILNNGATFQYENRQLQYSMKKSIEYNGEDMGVSMYWDVHEAHSAGTYQVAIFVDGQMVGSRSISMK